MKLKNNKKENIFRILTDFCLSLSLVLNITNMVYVIFNSNNVMDNIFSIIVSILFSIISIILILVNLNFKNKKIKIFNIVCSIILTIYSIISILFGIGLTKEVVIDFTGMDIKEVVSWAEDRDILIEQTFKNSETIDKYKVISQSVREGTNIKKVKFIRVVVSDGFSEDVVTEVDSMVGWKLDDVIKFIDDNHLTNVTILFEFSNTIEKDIIISQDVLSDIKRNEPITLVSSLGKKDKLKYVTMENIVGLDLFHALIYLGRNNLNYEIEYNYSDKDENIILKQNIKKWEVIDTFNMKPMIITVSKKDKITIPDFNGMTATEINTWATNNRLKVEITKEYDDNIKKDKFISSNYKKGNLVNTGDIIEIVISKGELRMIKFTNLEDFETWAKENNVLYDVEYEYNNSIKKGNLISISHNKNSIIKNNDTVKIVLSQGGNTTIPNLVGMTKEEALNSCKKANLECKFIYEDDNKEYNVVTKQSMRENSNVPTGTNITITMGK